MIISWATSCQYQCVWKILSKYFKRFKSYRHFFTNRTGTKSSRTGRGQNLHKLSGDKIKCLIIGHSMKFNFKFQLTFLGSCNMGDIINAWSTLYCKIIGIWFVYSCVPKACQNKTSQVRRSLWPRRMCKIYLARYKLKFEVNGSNQTAHATKGS